MMEVTVVDLVMVMEVYIKAMMVIMVMEFSDGHGGLYKGYDGDYGGGI